MTTVSPTTGLIRADVIELAEPDEDAVFAAEFAAGLRTLADAIEQHPRLAEIGNLRYGLGWTLVGVETREAVQLWARAGLSAGARVTKHQGDKYAGVDIQFGPVTAHVYVEREELCERVVTGVREVTEDVPDPEALAAVPIVAVTKTVEDVEWVCRPILAGGEL